MQGKATLLVSFMVISSVAETSSFYLLYEYAYGDSLNLNNEWITVEGNSYLPRSL
jgi:hypothetical protein